MRADNEPPRVANKNVQVAARRSKNAGPFRDNLSAQKDADVRRSPLEGVSAPIRTIQNRSCGEIAPKQAAPRVLP